MRITIIHNPYSGIDWESTPRVKAVSHEHVFDATKLSKMYDRGIRMSASVHYQPAITRYPYSSFADTYEDWLFFDIDQFYSHPEQQYNDVVTARKKVPADRVWGILDAHFRQNGLILAYTDMTNNVKRYTKLLRALSTGETWDELCEDETAWSDLLEADVSQNLVRSNRTYYGGFPQFTSKSSVSEWTGMASISFEGDGLTHNSDDIPRIPNAEHTTFDFTPDSSAAKVSWHFNVLGTLFQDAAWSNASSTTWRVNHPLYTINQINTVFPLSSSFHDNKLFGTVNHCNDKNIFRTLQDIASWFKGYEVFNNGSSKNYFELRLSNFHDLLNEGRPVYCLAVTDWQDDFRGCSDVDGGTNVLYLPANYNSLTTLEKSYAGLDSYVDGKFVASRFGSQHVVDFSVDENAGTAHFEVSDTAKDISLVFNGNYVTLHDVSEIEASIPRGTTNITAEAWFADSNEEQIYKSDTKLADDSDFIFTQAIIVETPKKDSFMDNKMMMFALDDGHL